MCVYINPTRGPFSDTDAFFSCNQKKKTRKTNLKKEYFFIFPRIVERGPSTQKYGIWINDIAELWLITHHAIRACCWMVQERIDPRTLYFLLPIMKFSSLSLHTNGCHFFLRWLSHYYSTFSSLVCICSLIVYNYFSNSTIGRDSYI